MKFTIDARNIAILSIVWIGIVMLVNPAGNFPLNDDWAYGKAVETLANNCIFVLNPRIGTSLVAQLVWGWLFCLPFGFSFFALRISTLVMGVFGVFAAYAMIRQLNGSRVIAIIGAFTIMTNPIYMGLSNTFMTDVPFFTFAMWSLFFFIRYIKSEEYVNFISAIMLACAASLTRQIGIAIPVSFGIAYIVYKGLHRRILIKAILPSIVTAFALTWYQSWLESANRLPLFYGSKLTLLTNVYNEGIPFLIITLIEQSVIASIYLGFFLLPLLILMTPWREVSGSGQRKALFICTFIVLIATVGISIYRKVLMPLTGNVLCNFGLGPATLRDTYYLKLSHISALPEIFWLVVTMLGIFGSVLLFQNLFIAATVLILRKKDNLLLQKKAVTALILSILLLYFMPIGIIRFFDRYLIFMVPLLMLLLINVSAQDYGDRKHFLVVMSVTLLVLYGVFSIGLTHDYMAWNRARWSAIKYLTDERKISWERIDGGFEFNGFYGYDKDYKSQNGKSLWWVKDDEYIITFGPIEGYDEIKRFSYNRWIPLKKCSIRVLFRRAIPQ